MPSQSFQQTLSQQQTLAPQMQQSLQVLQVATLELRNLIQQELEINPVLEMETKDSSLEERQKESDDKFDEEFSQLSKLDEEWREYMAQSRTASSGRNRDAEEKHQFLMDSLTSSESLQEHLLDQLRVSELEGEREKLIGEWIIGNIDDDGYLQVTLEEIAEKTQISLTDAHRILSVIQSFDPVGVGARNLAECLLIQLHRLGKQSDLAAAILENHFDDFAKRRLPQIAKRLKVNTEEVVEAAEIIATLDPKPGRIFVDNPSTYIAPDVVVERQGEDFVIRLTNEHIPTLRISNMYKNLMTSSNGQNGGEVKKYIRDKIRSGQFLIKSIHQRQETIENIAKEIVRRQRDFFEQGVAHLHPLNMSQVAEAVGVHETTVSRAIAGKYMATPQGIYEMKYFFTPGYRTSGGDNVSNTSVKDAIGELVKHEDKAKPLSDQALVKALAEKGIKIARRTIAKYREELNILPSHLRKGY